MLIKKQTSYLTMVVRAAWIAKVDYFDGQSQYNYGFTVENEEDEPADKLKITITLALRDMQVGDVFIIGKTSVLDTHSIKWFVIEDQTSFRAITKDTAMNEYEDGIGKRQDRNDNIFDLNNVSTNELKNELMKRQTRLNKDRHKQKASKTTTISHIGFKTIINKRL